MALVTVLVPLPEFYNPDETGYRRRIEEEKFTATAEEVARRFGGGVLWRFPEGTAPRGYWWNKRLLNIDILTMLEVDIQDVEEDRRWFERYASEVLTERFQQKAIYLKFYGAGGLTTITAYRKL
jgi:hypothetical protein